MKTLLSIIVVLVIGIGIAHAYSTAGIPEIHYPPTNDTKLELLVMNSTEFKERTTGYNYTLAGIDNNWIPKANNYYDFGGARVTFIVWGFNNGTVKGVAFNLDPQLKIKSIFEYNADNPPAGYYSDRCNCPLLGAVNSTKSLVEPKNVMDSPLKQFKSSVSMMNITCKEGLVLMIKKENGSPACVTPQTSEKLIERGWGSDADIPISLHPIQNVSVTSIKMIPPYTPGGPVIQLTLKNINMKSITSLNATLETNWNYTFNFKNVTLSTPLISGNSASDTTMLIGGGFQTELTYPLIISGVENNIPFKYTEKVHIQG